LVGPPGACAAGSIYLLTRSLAGFPFAAVNEPMDESELLDHRGSKDEGIKVRGGGEKMGERRVETPPEKYHARDNAKRHLS
jgi:hypothetical protein